MPYCRKCGAKLDEDARFCRVCGTPVSGTYTASEAPLRRRNQRAPLLIPVIILIAVLVVAFVVAALFFVPFQNVNFNQSESAPAQQGVNTVYLNFDADTAAVNVYVTDLPDQLVALNVSATGSVGIAGDAEHPVQVSFSEEKSGSTLNVTSKVTRTEFWPLSGNLQVTCNVYVDPSVVLNMNVAASTGKVTMNTDEAATFQALTLKTSTGEVQASLASGTKFLGDVSVTTSTGYAQLDWDNYIVEGNVSVKVSSSTGSVDVNVNQAQSLGGDVNLDASTSTGSVSLNMNIADGVGAMIESSTNLGNINVNTQHFNGNKSPLYSNNYPAATNFLVNLKTSTGSVNITANSQGTQTAAA